MAMMRCGFNRWLQRIDGIVQPGYRSLGSYAGVHWRHQHLGKGLSPDGEVLAYSFVPGGVEHIGPGSSSSRYPFESCPPHGWWVRRRGSPLRLYLVAGNFQIRIYDPAAGPSARARSRSGARWALDSRESARGALAYWASWPTPSTVPAAAARSPRFRTRRPARRRTQTLRFLSSPPLDRRASAVIRLTFVCVKAGHGRTPLCSTLRTTHARDRSSRC